MSDPSAGKGTRLQGPVSAILARAPAVVAVLVRHRMACPGCTMAAQIYGLDPVLLVRELEAASGELEG